MEELVSELKIALASSFAFYLKAQYFHWNVTGKDFVQLHDFFGKLYEEVLESIDSTAEHIRALDEYAPGSFQRFSELSIIQDETKILKDEEMIKVLSNDNQKLIEHLNKLFKEADQQNEQGLADYIAGRIDAHKKHGWMLRSIASR